MNSCSYNYACRIFKLRKKFIMTIKVSNSENIEYLCEHQSVRFDRQIHVLVGSKLGTEEEEYKILNDMNAILTVPRNLMKNVISGVFNKTNTSMPLQSFTKATKQAYKAECVVNFNFIKHTAYNNMSRSDNNVELLITLVKNNQQCLQGFRVEIVNHFIIISTL